VRSKFENCWKILQGTGDLVNKIKESSEKRKKSLDAWKITLDLMDSWTNVNCFIYELRTVFVKILRSLYGYLPPSRLFSKEKSSTWIPESFDKKNGKSQAHLIQELANIIEFVVRFDAKKNLVEKWNVTMLRDFYLREKDINKDKGLLQLFNSISKFWEESTPMMNTMVEAVYLFSIPTTILLSKYANTLLTILAGEKYFDWGEEFFMKALAGTLIVLDRISNAPSGIFSKKSLVNSKDCIKLLTSRIPRSQNALILIKEQCLHWRDGDTSKTIKDLLQ